MSFSDLIAAADVVVGEHLADLPVTIHFQDGSPDVTQNFISKNPAYEDDFVPGTPQGVAVLLLWARLDAISPFPRKGDTASCGGVDYDVFQVDSDREGGGTLRLRRRTQRWDQ